MKNLNIVDEIRQFIASELNAEEPDNFEPIEYFPLFGLANLTPEEVRAVAEAKEPEKTLEKYIDREIADIHGDIAEKLEDRFPGFSPVGGWHQLVEKNLWCIRPRIDSLMKEKINTVLCVDSGDSSRFFLDNTDLNLLKHEYTGTAKFRGTASLLWLIESQGRTKQDLWNALWAVTNYDDLEDEDPFMYSVYEELGGKQTDRAAILLPVEMTVQELHDLTMEIDRRNDLFIQAETVADIDASQLGHIIVNAGARFGLGDPYTGRCSFMRVQTEKPMVISVKYLHYAVPDGSICNNLETAGQTPENFWGNANIKLEL